MELLQDKNVHHILLTGGGIIPKADAEKLSKIGVGKLFGPGTSTRDIIAYIKEEVVGRRLEEQI